MNSFLKRHSRTRFRCACCMMRVQLALLGLCQRLDLVPGQDALGFGLGVFGHALAAAALPALPGAALGQPGELDLPQRAGNGLVWRWVRKLPDSCMAAAMTSTARASSSAAKPRSQPAHAEGNLAVAHHLGIRAHHAGFHLADAGKLVGPCQGRDQGVHGALEAVLDIQGVRVGGEAVDVDRQPVTVPDLHRAGRGQPQLHPAPDRKAGARLHHRQPPAVDDGQPGLGQLGQDDAGQQLGVLLGQGARQSTWGRWSRRSGRAAGRKVTPARAMARMAPTASSGKISGLTGETLKVSTSAAGRSPRPCAGHKSTSAAVCTPGPCSGLVV